MMSCCHLLRVASSGRRPKRRRYVVSRNEDRLQSSSTRMPRYSSTPRSPSTSLTADLAAGIPARPGMKSCGIEQLHVSLCPTWDDDASHTARPCKDSSRLAYCCDGLDPAEQTTPYHDHRCRAPDGSAYSALAFDHQRPFTFIDSD